MAQPHRLLVFFSAPAAEQYRALNDSDRAAIDRLVAVLRDNPYGDNETKFPFDPFELLYRLGDEAGFLEILFFSRMSYERGQS